MIISITVSPRITSRDRRREEVEVDMIEKKNGDKFTKTKNLLKNGLRRKILLLLFDFFEIVSVDEHKLRSALLRSDFKDFEDCLQNECAVEEKADCIITRNKKDFENADVKVYTPKEFIEMMEEA